MRVREPYPCARPWLGCGRGPGGARGVIRMIGMAHLIDGMPTDPPQKDQERLRPCIFYAFLGRKVPRWTITSIGATDAPAQSRHQRHRYPVFGGGSPQGGRRSDLRKLRGGGVPISEFRTRDDV